MGIGVRIEMSKEQKKYFVLSTPQSFILYYISFCIGSNLLKLFGLLPG
jgi:uncharacterized protein YybS (DUF2232 family)